MPALEHSLRILLPALTSGERSLPPIPAPLRHMLRMKPNASTLFPSIARKARRRNSFAALPRPNTVSSSASDLAVHPRKLPTAARHQTSDVRLLNRQTRGDLAI